MNRVSSIVNRQSPIINHKGFTLIEIIIFIVIAGIILPGILVPFATSLKESLTPEKVVKATYLAQYKMEELTKNNYDLLAPTPLTSYTSTEISGYQWQWQISCVDAALAASADVGYKLILVRVQDPESREIELQTVVTLRPGDE